MLALSTSPNENEAKTALLKARELMAEHKMSESDIEEVTKKQEVKTIICDAVKWTTVSGKAWMISLCETLADHYCCVAAWNTVRGRQVHTLCITGIEEDVGVCEEVIKYAVGFVESKCKAITKTARDPKASCLSYAKGFTYGLEFAFEEQNDSFGLVLVKSDEVKTYEDNLKNRTVRTRRANFDPLAYARGEQDGRNFNKTKTITQTA